MQYSHTSCVLTLHVPSASLANLVISGFRMDRLHATFLAAVWAFGAP
jgi:hypothetical protein